MTLSSFAATRVLYQQNFDKVEVADETGWTYGGASMTIASDEYGKFLELNQGQTNGRSAQVIWGDSIYTDADGKSLLGEDGVYNMKFDFSIKTPSNNQWNSAFTVFTNHIPAKPNQPYRTPWDPEGYWQNYIFDMSQVDKQGLQFAINGGTVKTEVKDSLGNVTGYKYSIDMNEPSEFTQGAWYSAIMKVNTKTREVEWTVEGLDGTTVKSGTLVVPETNVADGSEISMFAQGMEIMVARYLTVYDIDNIEISVESEGDFANAPTIALTRIGKTAGDPAELDLKLRAYTITFLDGETLHVAGTDGQELTAEYADCDGAYVYETTKSGKLTAWTTSGDATSEKVEVDVDCAPVVLPAATATITSVAAGYGKTYTLTVDNAEVPLRPTVFIAYQVLDESGNVVASAEDQTTGTKVTMDAKGSLKITTAAFGYESKETTVNNDIEFAVKNTYDFARFTKEQIEVAAQTKDWQVLNSSATSGFNNWTARKRLYYQDKTTEHLNDEGATVYDSAYPFGFVAEGDDQPHIEYVVNDNAGEEDLASTYVPGLTIFPGRNFGFMYRLGIYNDETQGGNNKNIVVNDLEATDFVLINTIDNYGGDSNHPIVATADEYYAQLAGTDEVFAAVEETETVGEGDSAVEVGTGKYSVTYPLYRIQKVCTKITVFKQIGAGVEGIEATEVAGDNYYYNLQGIRVAEPTHPGIYIHNGKKIVVK